MGNVKKIQKIVKYYYDGKMYDTEQEAIEARKKSMNNENNFIMFNREGKLTYQLEQCIFVYLKNLNSADMFIEANRMEDCECRGISSGDIGLYIWNEDYECFEFFDEDFYETAKYVLDTLREIES